MKQLVMGSCLWSAAASAALMALVLGAVVSCSTPSSAGGGANPIPQGASRALPGPTPAIEVSAGFEGFQGVGQAETPELAFLLAERDALARAARTRESHVISVVEIRTTLSSEDFLAETRVDAGATFRGYQVHRTASERTPEGFRGKVLVEVPRDQVFLGEFYDRALALPVAEGINELETHVLRAVGLGDLTTQAQGLLVLLELDPTAERVLKFANLQEQGGASARLVIEHYRYLAVDPNGILDARLVELTAADLDAGWLIGRLTRLVDQARNQDLSMSPQDDRVGPDSGLSIIIHGKPRHDTHWLWLDGETLEYCHLLPRGKSPMIFDSFGMDDSFVEGPVSALVLCGASQPPLPDPAIDLNKCRARDRSELQRLSKYVDALARWLRLGDHQALRVSWIHDRDV